MKKPLFISILLITSSLSLLSLVSSGCLLVAAGAAGAGTVAYVRGDLEATLDHNLDKSTRASNKAIEELKFAKVSEKKDLLTVVLLARTADDKRVQITLTRITDSQTKVAIRVAVFGDERVSLAILEKIKEAL